MRELLNFFGQRYSAVNTNLSNNNCLNGNDSKQQLQPLQHTDSTEKSGNSLQKTRQTFAGGFSIVDSFFHERKAGKGPRWPKGAFLLMACGMCAITSAILMYIIQPYSAIFKWKLIFAENGEIFNLWQNPPVNLYIKIYLFNITNAEQFMNGEEKMKVEEIGPYVYREKLLHDSVHFNENGTLSTIPRHPLIWNEEMSMGRKEDDIFMLPNIALLSIAQVTSDKSYFFRLPINLVIRQTNSQPIVKMTAKEFMFGYESPLTTLGNKFMPNWIYFEKVGLIDRMYDFDGDYETIFTGETDESISGLYDTYRGSTDLQQWSGAHCSNINKASDGTKFKSFIEPNETLLFFRKSMCRPSRMVRVGDEETVSSLTAYKYMFEDNAMDNGHVDKRNKCFCKNGKCLLPGLLDISDCYYGFPIALSYPHFLDSDEQLVKSVIGSRPNRSEHESYFMIQPMSGLPLKLSVKFQINMAMRDVSNMANVGQFSNIVVPMLWFEITMPTLPDSLLTRFNLYLNILPVLDMLGQGITFIGGILLLLIAVTKAALRFSRSIQQSHKISNQRRYSTLASSNKQPTDYISSNCDNLSYELTEKCINHNDDHLCEIDFANEKQYMLEEEPAISEDDDDDENENDSEIQSLSFADRDDDHAIARINENDAFIGGNSSCSQSLINPISSSSTICQLGDTSSNLDDLGTDNFHVLQITEDRNRSDSISVILDNVGLI